jgi:nickel-dependent lactate racemase
MKKEKFKFGNSSFEASINQKNLLDIIRSNPFNSDKTEEEIISDALINPIGSPRLKSIVKPTDRVCVIIPDSTRTWQKPNKFLPKIVEELEQGGIKDENIVFISALGTHRKQNAKEHELLLGTDLYKRFKVIDHDCHDKNNLVYLGETSYKTPVWVNKIAMECDHIVITGGIVYHFLVGFSGGKKSILPGISSYETVMANHHLSLSKELGSGSNPSVRCGNLIDNPVHNDMMEATALVKPTFMFNVVMTPDGKICGAVAGDYIEAHAAGRDLVSKIDGVETDKKGDLIIGSSGGYPKDINLYQSIKGAINMREAANENATLILISECLEGLGGNSEVQDMILNYDSLLDREKELRENYSISKFVGYYFCECGEKYDFILVSALDPALVRKANITVVKTLDEALELTYAKKGENLKTILMPDAANTLPVVSEM